jgi:hypothetical protein
MLDDRLYFKVVESYRPTQRSDHKRRRRWIHRQTKFVPSGHHVLADNIPRHLASTIHIIDKDDHNNSVYSKGMDTVVMVQTGFGCCHGRNATKASIRAVRNAIESNSIKVRTIIPGGYENLKIHLQLGIPEEVLRTTNKDCAPKVDDGPAVGKYPKSLLDLEAIQNELPYGTIIQPIDLRIPGGLIVGTGTELGGMGDSPKDDMTVVVACVSVGY